jgi:hypothetical protein
LIAQQLGGLRHPLVVDLANEIAHELSRIEMPGSLSLLALVRPRQQQIREPRERQLLRHPTLSHPALRHPALLHHDPLVSAPNGTGAPVGATPSSGLKTQNPP